MHLIEDSRQQRGCHERKHAWWEENGVTLTRSKIAFGDYCLPPAVSVDTKASISELAYDIDHDHARFKRELVGARDAGVQLVVLVENEDGVTSLEELAEWAETPEDFARRKFAKRRLHGSRLAKACATMAERYGARFVFCAPEDAAELICKLLEEGGAR